jgi:hypothetical protein
MLPGQTIVNEPVASVAVWLVMDSCMFEHCDMLAGNVAAWEVIGVADTQLPVSHDEEAAPDDVGLDVADSAGWLVGARTLASLFELQALASAATAARLRSRWFLFMWLICGLRNRNATRNPGALIIESGRTSQETGTGRAELHIRCHVG